MLKLVQNFMHIGVVVMPHNRRHQQHGSYFFLISEATAQMAGINPNTIIITLRPTGALLSASCSGRTGGRTNAMMLPNANAPPKANSSQGNKSFPRNASFAAMNTATGY